MQLTTFSAYLIVGWQIGGIEELLDAGMNMKLMAMGLTDESADVSEEMLEELSFTAMLTDFIAVSIKIK